MDALQSFRRRRTMKKMQTAGGVQAAGRRRRPGGRLVAHHKEPADVHALLADDAQPNLRVWQMWDEACDFEGELERFRHNLSKFEAATHKFLMRLEPILRAPLPRVWDAVEGGLAEPTRATISHGHGHTVGGDASIAGFEEARSDFHNRLRANVVRPLHQWSEALAVVEERLPELNALRAQVIKNSRAAAKSSRNFRETAATTGPAGGAEAGAIVPLSGRGGGGGIGAVFGACAGHGGASRGARRHQSSRADDYDDGYTNSDSDDDDVYPRESGADREARREVAMEEAGLRLNYKHRKLMASRADYAETEKLLAEQLSGLQRDASWTKSYVVSALMLTKEAMQTAVVSLGNTKQPLPGFTSRSSLLPSRHGQLSDNIALVAAMPADLNLEMFEGQLASGGGIGIAAGSGAAALPPPMVHAHKATAQPMELHARPDVAALDRVHSPHTGAGAISMSLLPAAVARAAPSPVVESPTTSVVSSEAGQGYATRGSHALGGRRAADEAGTYTPTSATTGSYRAASDVGGLRSHSEPATATMGSSSGAHYRDAGAGSSGIQAGAGSSGLGYTLGSVGVMRSDNTETVCSHKVFTEIEDRPIVKERVATIVEHRPVEKRYVTEVRYMGETALAGSAEVVGGAQTRLVSVAEPSPKCPTGANASAAVAQAAGFGAQDRGTSQHVGAGLSDRQHHSGAATGDSSSSSPSSSSSGSEGQGLAGAAARRTAHPGAGAMLAGSAGEAAPVTVTGAARDRHGGSTVTVLREDQSEAICSSKTFTQFEDRPITRERVASVVEHRPVEKRYVTEVRFVGEAPLAGGSEVVGPAEERVVSVAERGPTCPTGIGSAGKGGLSMTAGGEASGMVNHDVAAAPAGAGDVEGGSLARPSGLVGGQSVVV